MRDREYDNIRYCTNHAKTQESRDVKFASLNHIGCY